ncbi:MAG TPA: ABC transporter permease [Phycisphaerales bacterium]|nr:ABC transporter permease [Phycisphaerales bacterium]
MTFLLDMVKLGLGNLLRHKLRSFLTALGIIFGVAAVITMVAIGEGSKQQALARIEQLGARNIIIRSQRPPESQQMGGGQQRGRSMRYGLTRDDLAVIRANFADAEAIVPLKEVGSQILRENVRQTSQTLGTTPDLQRVANLRIARGRYLTQADLEGQEMVAVIGAEVARTMFPFDDPLENTLRIDQKTVRIVGVLAPIGLAGGAGAALVGRDMNLDVHIPLTTAQSVFGDRVFKRTSGTFQASEVPISEVYIASDSRDNVLTYASLARRVVEVRHPGMTDVALIVPYELLESARRDALTWQLVLGFIAGISLLVGGIGIMNIMLASVTERTREIGIRRALGATRRHITTQFLIETGVLSVLGGILGAALGVGSSVGLNAVWPLVREQFRTNIELATQTAPWSIFLAFGVAAVTGLVFGLYPAIKASKQDPIVALRHD